MRWRRRSLLQTIVSWLRAWNGPPAVQQRIAPVSASVMRPAARCGRCSNRSKGGRPFNPQANEQKRSANRDLGEPSLHCGRGRIIGEPTAYPPAKGPARPSKGEKFKKQKKMVRFVVDRCPALPCPALPIAGMAAPVWCKWADSRGPPRCPIRQRQRTWPRTRWGLEGGERQGEGQRGTRDEGRVRSPTSARAAEKGPSGGNAVCQRIQGSGPSCPKHASARPFIVIQEQPARDWLARSGRGGGGHAEEETRGERWVENWSP